MTTSHLPTPAQVRAELTAEEGCRFVKTGKYPSWTHFFNLYQHVFNLEETVRKQAVQIAELQKSAFCLGECFDDLDESVEQLVQKVSVIGDALIEEGLIYSKPLTKPRTKPVLVKDSTKTGQ